MRQVKASGEGAFALAPTVRVTISTLPNLLSPINLRCHRIKDGGYKNIKSANKVSPTQNTPALQASKIQKTQDARRLQISDGNYGNYVIDKLTCEIMENKPLGSRM